MRFLAFTLLSVAAFDWPAPWLDRLGAAALGFGFLALAVGSQTSSLRRALPFGASPPTTVAADASADPLSDLLSRFAPYSLSARDDE